MNAVIQNQNTDIPFASTPITILGQSDNNVDLEKALRLSGILQTTLDINKLIELFSREVIKFVSYQHIKYNNSELNIDQEIGSLSKHSCTYRLVVSGETLGELVFSRNKKFSQADTSLLEALLCGLVYPLRNTLMYQKAVEAAHKDPLTGVNNRASMDDIMDREVNLADRHNTNLSLLALDIDFFKKINDTHGHAVGDCVIKAIAEASSAAIRTSDMVFRFGGEEFLILLSNTNREGATLLADRLRQKIEETCVICDGTQVSATVSIGVTSMIQDDSRSAMFSRADAALYQAKSAGRNCCKFFSIEND